MLLSLYLAVLDDQSKEEQFIDVYNTYKRLVYHTAYKIMGDSYLAEDVLQEVFLYVAKNFSKIHRENCHELAAYAGNRLHSPKDNPYCRGRLPRRIGEIQVFEAEQQPY